MTPCCDVAQLPATSCRLKNTFTDIYLFYKMLLKKSLVFLNNVKYKRFYTTTKMSSPTLYYDDVSPPARFVLMTAHHLDVKLHLHKVDLFKNENRTTFYKSINPLHKVPAMSVNNQTIRDSHAIALYLCGMSNSNIIYPEHPLERAKVHEMMFYNSSTLFPIDSTIFTNYFAGKTDIDDSLISSWSTALDYLENRLKETSWLSGNVMTLSDLCCVTTVSSVDLLIPVKENTPRVYSWLHEMKKQPLYEINLKGLNRLSQFIQLMK